MKKRINYYLLLLVFSFLTSSCSSVKNVPYFQDQQTDETETINNFSPITVQPQDILGINVTSLNPLASDIYNTNQNRVNGNNFDINPTNPITGILVDQNGNILLPSIGSIKVAGLTIPKVQEKIYNIVSPNLKEASVTVRLINFKISVIGDVEHPGVYPISNERVTITDALGLAGDLNITATRTNVLLVREIDGQRKFFHIDLTSKNLFSSPYYYLKNNDLIYVTPGKLKYAQASQGLQIGALLLSALSIVAIVYSTLHR